MKHPTTLRAIATAALILTAWPGRAAQPIEVGASLTGGAGSGDFAPYYIGSNNHGIVTQANNMLIGIDAAQRHAPGRRFSYEWGVQVIGGYASSAPYRRYVAETGWTDNPQHPSRLWLQQLYGELRYRSLFLRAGMKNSSSGLLNDALSSGDVTESPNARPIPQVRAGFIDFQPVPFTNGWIEIQGEISYGKMTDNGWMRSHYNYYNEHICTGSIYTYKRCYFRSKSSMPLSVTVGMQTAGFVGGTTDYYSKGVLTGTEHHAGGIKEMIKMFIPTEGDELYYLGSTLGSWDILLRYRLPWGGEIKGYLEKLWETGSGIGFLNGLDGLWGLEYKARDKGPVTGVVLEYLDFTNQSGPIHYDPEDHPGITLDVHTNGGDDYYNNYTYNAYMNYGMSLGTPMLRSPLYNLDGYMCYVDNCVRGFHIGITGEISDRLSYRLLGGYRKGWGAIRLPRSESVDDTSIMLEGTYIPPIADNKLTINAKIALDRGTMYGNTFGALVTVAYRTSFNPSRHD